MDNRRKTYIKKGVVYKIPFRPIGVVEDGHKVHFHRWIIFSFAGKVMVDIGDCGG